MTTIIHRSALVYHGHEVSDDLAYVVSDHDGRRVVTWPEVLEARRELQRTILARKRHVEPWRAVRLWVAHFDQNLFGGWQAFLGDWLGRHHETWIDRDGKSFKEPLMRLFPVCLPLGTEYERWERWKEAFALEYRRRRQCRQPVGVAYLWRRGRELSRVPPSMMAEQPNREE